MLRLFTNGDLLPVDCQICMTRALDVKQRLALARELELIADKISIVWREAGYLRLAARQLRRPLQ